ncbi:hypothetical protein [Actinoplanes sp. NPDC020271]|uniref:hypothetical protein n=1 Tax=Actinoplanes sp. NPDC020271 TaxID=3363896 RepID=UPI0037BAA064
MRGIPIPVSTTSMPASARIVSNKGRVLAVPIADQVFDLAAGVLEVHDQVPGDLHDPRGGRMWRDAEDPDAAGGVFDDRQHVTVGTGQCHGFEEVRGDQGLGPGA